MNIKRQNLLSSLALGSSLLLLGTLPAIAQTGNQSNVSGPIMSTGDITGGGLAPRSGNGTGTVSSSNMAVNLSEAAAAIIDQPDGVGLQVAAGNGASIPAIVQQPLVALLTGNVAIADQMQGALLNAPGMTNTPQNAALVKNLVSSVQGLIKTSGNQSNADVKLAYRVSVTQLRVAVEAYNALIDASSVQALRNPSPELLAIRSVLFILTKATVATR